MACITDGTIDIRTIDIREEVREMINKKFNLATKSIRKWRWTRGFNCRRVSRTFGSWRY